MDTAGVDGLPSNQSKFMENQVPDPLLEWNRLNTNNAENALVSVMHLNTLSHSTRVDKFSTWLIAGTGVTAGLMITNVANILPFLGGPGFRFCGALLAISAVCGFAAKIKATIAQMGYDNNRTMTDEMRPILDRHSDVQDRIEEAAAKRNVNLETNIDMGRVLREYVKPIPKWVGWMMFLHLKKHEGDPQVGYIIPVRAFFWQGLYTTLQALFYVAFFIVALCVVEVQN